MAAILTNYITVTSFVQINISDPSDSLSEWQPLKGAYEEALSILRKLGDRHNLLILWAFWRIWPKLKNLVQKHCTDLITLQLVYAP